MAVTLKIDICPSGDCKSFNFTETTGAYNETYNPTGWGSPNDTPNPDWDTTLTITDPNNIETILNMAVYGFPTDNTNFTFPISASLLTNNTTGTLDDGIYNFTYTAVSPGGGTTYSTTFSLYSYCNIQCCVYKMTPDRDWET